MKSLKLWFVSSGTVTLERTSFEHPLLDCECRAVRGKTSGAYLGYQSFQWTPAVQALAILLLRTAAAPQSAPQQTRVIIEGLKGSPAASLDYSISKSPNWLLDVFGIEKNGRSIAQRLFKRTNSERKRSAPVAIAVNENMLTASEIIVFVNDERVLDPCKLQEISDEIFQNFYQGQDERLIKADNLSASNIMRENFLDSLQHSVSAAVPCTDCPRCGQKFVVKLLSTA